MFRAVHKSSGLRKHAGWPARLVLTTSILLAAGGIAARSALATGVPFQRGDLIASVSGGIDHYAQDGTLKDTFGSGSGGGPLCFDPNGRYLVAPGVGLFDTSGNRLPSNWSSVVAGFGGDECAVDGFGHVYLSGGAYGRVGQTSWGTIRKFDRVGNLLQSYIVDTTMSYLYGPMVSGLDVAPDQCTTYYNSYGGAAIERFNACTNTQEAVFVPPSGGGIESNLRVLPNWDVAVATEQGLRLFDPSGQDIAGFRFTTLLGPISLDPAGSTLWTGTSRGPVFRVDPVTGRILASWNACGNSTCRVYDVATYGPPLLGNANVSSNVDYNPAGTAEAFATRVGYSGQMSSLDFYVDSSSTASQAVVGIYADHNGRPGALQTRATIANVMPGSWNYAAVPSISVSSGQRLWIAVLGPTGGGTIRFRDAFGGGRSQTSAQNGLSSLPTNWSPGSVFSGGSLSAFGN